MAKAWLKKLILLAILAAICVILWFMVVGYLVKMSEAALCSDEYGRMFECESIVKDWQKASGVKVIAPENWEGREFQVEFHITVYTTLARAGWIEQQLNKLLKPDIAHISIELKMEEE